MEEKQVEVIKKVDGPVIRDSRKMGKPLTITRKRVAAYVRVSTNGEEQIQSFNSQKLVLCQDLVQVKMRNLSPF